MTDVLARAGAVSPELARWLAALAEKPLAFPGPHALDHSRANHEHLWLLEQEADRDRRLDAAFRRDAVRWLLDRWRARLPGYAPWQRAGFWLYVYEDLAPTLTAVAADAPVPMFGEGARFVPSLDAVLAPYATRRWSDLWRVGPDPAPAVLDAVARHAGSLGAPTAAALGLSRAELRRWIEALDLRADVNALRKRFRRRPARFRTDTELTALAAQAPRVYAERVPGRGGG